MTAHVVSPRGIPLSDLPSRCPDPALRADRRIDPYWAALWNVGSSAVWLSRSNAERMAAAGLATPSRREVGQSIEEATRRVAGRQPRLAALAALGMWRTATDEQIASITGSAKIKLRRSADRDALWASGLVQRGQFMSGLPSSKLPTLLRVSNTTGIDLLASMLSYRELIGVTSGQPWRWGSQHDRHNLLATELGLRIAEYTSIAAVFGEQLGAAALLHPEGLAAGSGRAADAVLVRQDGMRIAVEMTSTATDNMPGKIQRWVKVLESDRSRGLAVLFVEMPHPDREERMNRKLERQIVKATGTTSSALGDVQSRIMVARWQDWFPAYGEASEAFTTLTVHRPTGSRAKDRLDSVWEPVSILDPFELTFDRPRPDALAILDNQNLLYGIPYWLRTGPGPVAELDSAVLSAVGRSEELKAAGYRQRRAR